MYARLTRGEDLKLQALELLYASGVLRVESVAACQECCVSGE